MGSAKQGGHSAVYEENKESDILEEKWNDRIRDNGEVHLKFRCII